MTDFTIFFLYVAIVLIAVFFITIIIVRKKMMTQGVISRSLNLELLLVRFGSVSQQELNLQQMREKIALMEQFFANLHLIRDSWWRVLLYGKPVFALEITVPSVGEEISFFVAVPRRLARAVEKMIQGVFPEAMVEPTRDYNIFNPIGASAGSVMRFEKNIFYPIRTYQKLEGDPLRGITNTFTKLAREGEGAAVQIVARPAAGKWRGILREKARVLHSGKKEERPLLLKTISALGDATRSAPTPILGQPYPLPKPPEELRRLTPAEDEVVRALETKAGKILFEADVRLVASASTEARAEAIVQGLELAFAQYRDPNLNAFRAEHVTGRKFKEFAFQFSFRTFDTKKKIVVNSEELTSLFHFPNVPLETPHVKIVRAREAAPPVDMPREGTLLGYNVFRAEKTDIRMRDEDRRRHLYVIGQTGTGKSAFLENLAVQDIDAGSGVCCIDPHGETIERILSLIPRHRYQDVVYFNPGDIARPMGLNMLEYDPNFPEQKTFIVNELFSIFQKLYGAVPESLGPVFEQYFRNATMLVMDDPASGNTLLDIARVMSDKAFRDLKLSRARNIVVKNFWTQVAEKAVGESELRNVVPYITSKFDVFLANEIMRPIIAQQKSSFNFREIMDSQKILLVNLSKGRLGDINSSLIGLIVVGKILMAALSRADMLEERRRDFYLYIDEFQNVTTDSIATILSEARKYHLNLVIAHQFIGQLKDEIKKAVFGNVGSMATFRIGSDDAEFMAKQYKPVFAEQDLLNINNYNCYIKLLIAGHTSLPFNMKTYPPERGDRTIAETVKEISRAKYGRQREEIEREIEKRHQ